jgi:hypothetical protein
MRHCSTFLKALFFALLAPAFLVGGSAFAQQATNAPVEGSAVEATNGAVRLPEVTVTGRQDSMLGIAQSATQGTVGR